MSVGYFNYSETCDLCLQKFPNSRHSFWLQFIPRESITNTKNSTNIQNNSKSFLDVRIGSRRGVFGEKNEDKNLGTLSKSNAWTNPVISGNCFTLYIFYGATHIIDKFIFLNNFTVSSFDCLLTLICPARLKVSLVC